MNTLACRSRLAFVLAFAVAASGLAPVLADQPRFLETFELTPEPCDGLARSGVTYAFLIGGVPSTDCVAGTFVGPLFSNNISAPNIEGNAAGVMHLRFDVPTTTFGFGIAQSTVASPQLKSVVIHLNRPGAGLLREEVFLNTTSDPLFVGGRYDYDGPAVRTVTIQFSGPAGRFVVDNMTYFRPPGRRP